MSIAGIGAAILSGLCLPAIAPDEAAAANAGRTTAVVQQARGTPPGQPTRTLRPRLDVFQDERIQTDELGVTQILFTDGTHLTVGPQSDLVVDEYFYNRDTATGGLLGRLSQGVLRFVGGQVSKRGKVEISTPVAVIGVRGGIAVLEHDTEDGTKVVFLFGEEVTVTGLGPDAQSTETKTISRAGFSTSVSPDGDVADPTAVDAEELGIVLSALEATEETDQEESETPRAGREVVAKAASDYSEDSKNTPAGPGSGGPGSTRTQGQGGSGQESEPVPEAVEEVLQQADAPLSPPGLWIYDVASSNVSYSLPALRFGADGQVHPVTIIKREGDLGRGGYRVIFVRSRFEGTGASQEAAVVVITGYVGPSSDYEGNRFLSRVAGSARGPSVATEGGPSSDDMYLVYLNGEDDGQRFGGGVPPESFTAVGEERSDGQRRISVQAHDDSQHVFNPVVEYRLRPPVLPVTHYGSRSDGIWKGYATGLFEGWQQGSTTPFIYVLNNRADSPEDVVFRHNTEYSFLGASFELGDPQGNPGGVQGMRLGFGAYIGQRNELRQEFDREELILSYTRGTYLSDEVFAAQSSLVWWYDEDNDTFRYQRLMWVDRGAGPELVPLSEAPFAAKRVWLFSNDAAPADGLLQDGVRFCDCSAARFGWWGGRVSFGDPNDPDDPQRQDDVFPGTFVVGLLPEIADIPTVGTASYSGHAGAAINDGSATYAAVGGFSMDWNFGTRTGTANINNLDGRSYAANDLAAPIVNPRDFSGNFNQVSGTDPASGPVNGSFFSDGSNPVVDVGGQFTVTSTGGYTATGSFAATSQ
ncbi:MAG: FecR domain-containing protein [Alphaproteobacteria bacterium]|nr:FecR domain-containing protein [Alphaproteobacteria bacterium]